MMASYHFCLFSCLSGWTTMELRGSDIWKPTSSRGSLCSSQLSPVGFFQAEPWTGQSLPSSSPGLQSCFLLFPPVPLWILKHTISWLVQPSLPPAFTNSSSLFASMRTSSHHTPETSWIAQTQGTKKVLYPSSRYQGGWKSSMRAKSCQKEPYSNGLKASSTTSWLGSL